MKHKPTSENSFVTLSYSDEHLRNTGASTTNIYRNSGKRLRKRLGPMRYYAVGEYGG